MRKTFFALLSLCLPALTAMADNVPGLVVKTSDSEVTIPLSGISSIDYKDETTMYVNYKDASATASTFTLGNVVSMYFSNVVTGIEGVESDKGVNGFVVYDASGKKVLTGSTTDCLPDLSSLQSGTYIININGNTIKVVK